MEFNWREELDPQVCALEGYILSLSPSCLPFHILADFMKTNSFDPPLPLRHGYKAMDSAELALNPKPKYNFPFADYFSRIFCLSGEKKIIILCILQYYNYTSIINLISNMFSQYSHD